VPAVNSSPTIRDYIPTFAEMRLPRINIIQKSSDAIGQFPLGSVVYRKTATLYIPRGEKEAGTEPGQTVILGLLPTRWAEKRKGEIGGDLVSSPAEVRALGGTTDYAEWKKSGFTVPYFEQMAEFICMLKQPKHLPNAASIFPWQVDGERYGLGIWAMRGAAFNNCAKFIFSDRQIGPTYEHGYPSCLYGFTTWHKAWDDKRSAELPRFTALEPTSESFQKFAAEIIAGSVNVEETGSAEE
jgi:hypothetical protein